MIDIKTDTCWVIREHWVLSIPKSLIQHGKKNFDFYIKENIWKQPFKHFMMAWNFFLLLFCQKVLQSCLYFQEFPRKNVLSEKYWYAKMDFKTKPNPYLNIMSFFFLKSNVIYFWKVYNERSQKKCRQFVYCYWYILKTRMKKTKQKNKEMLIFSSQILVKNLW